MEIVLLAQQQSWAYVALFVTPYALLGAAWARRRKNEKSAPPWRSKTLLVGLLLLSVALAELTAELTYRYVQGHKLAITPAIGKWASANALLCLIGGILIIFGKGRGRFIALLAAPVLVFIWAIHVAF
jgi:hypothetical protein